MGTTEKRERGSLRPRRKPDKRSKKLAKAVIEFLTSDSYMYAPLINRCPVTSLGLGILHESLSVGEFQFFRRHGPQWP